MSANSTTEDRSIIFTRSLLRRFINLYRDSPCLWNKQCPSYKNKQERNEAISKLTALVREHDPKATPVHVLRKIDSLRACVRRESNKMQKSRLYARSKNDYYNPTLWYYPMFSFITQEADRQNTVVTKTEEVDTDEQQNSEPEEYLFAYHDSPSSQPDQTDEAPSTSVEEVTLDLRPREEVPKRSRVEVDDQYDAVGLIVASKLRGLQPNMRIVAEKLINDILYQAQTNGLNSSSIIYTPDPFK